MRNKFTTILIAMFGATLLTTNASAMNINLKLDKTINYKFSFSIDLYDTSATMGEHQTALSVEGVDVANVDSFMTNINNIISAITPTTSLEGKPSTISLSYSPSDGVLVSPTSCSDINATSSMNIFMGPHGCTVS